MKANGSPMALFKLAKVRWSRKRPRTGFSVLLVLALLCGCLQTNANAADAPTPSVEHGFIKDISFYSNVNKDATILPDFVFRVTTAEYDYSLPTSVGNNAGLKITPQEPIPSNLYYSVMLNGNTNTAQSGKLTGTASVKMPEWGTTNPRYEKNVLTVLVGLQDSSGNFDEEQLDVYKVNLTASPHLNGLEIKNGSEKIPTTFKAPNLAQSAEELSAVTITAITNTEVLPESITLSKFSAQAPLDANESKLYLGNAEYGITNTNRYLNTISPSPAPVVNLSDYAIYSVGDDVYIAEIPVRVVGNDPLNYRDYKLYLTTEDLSPVVAADTTAHEYDKGEPLYLTVSTESPESGELSYQWYISKPRKAAFPIAGETTPILQSNVGTEAGDFRYICRVTNTVGSMQFSTSVSFPVSVKLSYINEPVIVMQPGVYSEHSAAQAALTGLKYTEYKTHYYAGQAIDTLRISVITPESGVLLRYDVYANTENSYDNESAWLLQKKFVNAFGHGESSTETTSDGSVSISESALDIADHFAAGTYYCYVTVTAYDERGILDSVSINSDIFTVSFEVNDLDFDGGGTEDNPYLLKNSEDLKRLQQIVNNGNTAAGAVFLFMNDITLPENWAQIGFDNGSDNRCAFAGIINGGGHTLTVPAGSKSLIGFAGECTVKNLKIYGEEIAGNGLIDGLNGDYGEDNDYWTGCPDGPTLKNIILLSGTKTLRSGLMEGTGSGANTLQIINCIVEPGVVIGYSKDQGGIGSFVGANFNGVILNSQSAADVYGTFTVGGLAAKKGQSMGICLIRNSSFTGKIIATGDWIGGILGQGYYAESAPNTPPASIVNCNVVAEISGHDYVGGVFGGERGLLWAIDESNIDNNSFFGNITVIGEHVGGIIGYYLGINNLTSIKNNYFCEESNSVTKALGGYSQIDSIETPVSTSDSHRMTAEELSAFNASLAAAPKTTDEYADGTAVSLLNGGDFNNWKQYYDPKADKAYAILDLDIAVLEKLIIRGDYETEYQIGDDLSSGFANASFVAVYSNECEELIDISKIEFSGYNNQERGVYKVTARYKSVSIEFTATVLERNPDGITVYFTLLGDDLHKSDEDGNVHTLAAGNLQTWITKTAYTLDGNATVLDLIRKALGENSITFEETDASGTTYIPNVTRNGVKLGEFTNGINSGWLYTINGKDSDLSVSQQFLADGDEIVFHYSDDYTKEDYAMGWTGTIVNDAAAVGATTAIDAANGTVSVTCARACAVLAKKSDGSYILLAATVSGNTATYSVTGYSEILIRVKGDLTGDGKLDSSDTLMLKKLAARLIEPDGITALLMDLTGDGTVNSSDILKSKRLAVGLDTMAW